VRIVAIVKLLLLSLAADSQPVNIYPLFALRDFFRRPAQI
jgi:hypothetical protein